jgi:hypothetical protein
LLSRKWSTCGEFVEEKHLVDNLQHAFDVPIAEKRGECRRVSLWLLVVGIDNYVIFKH